MEPDDTATLPQGERRQDLNPPLATLDAIVEHYSSRLSRDRVEEVILREKAVFVIRRDTALSDTHAQFLRRLQAVLDGMVGGRELPDLPIFIDDCEALMPHLR